MQSRNRAALLEEFQKRTASRRIRLVDLSGVRELMDPVNRLPDGWNYGGDGVAARAGIDYQDRIHPRMCREEFRGQLGQVLVERCGEFER